MPKPPKASARFAFIKRKTFPFQTVRLCLTYKGKRLYYTDESYNWYGVDLTQFNSDGSLKLKRNNPEKDYYKRESDNLLRQAKLAVFIAQEADKRGVWKVMTSRDLFDFLGYDFLFQYREQGISDDISEQMYEWRWQRVGKGKA